MLQKIAKKYKHRPDLEHRRQAARPDPPPHPARLRPRRHRPAGALLQARPGPLHRVRAADRRQEGLGPRRGELLPRRRAVPEEEGPGDLGQPHKADARAGAEEARRRGARPRARRRSCSGSPSAAGRSMRAVALHPDVIVVVSAIWQTTCTAVRGGRRGVRDRLAGLPDELDALPGAARAGRLPGLAACSPPTATGTTCSAGSRSRRPRSAAARRRPRGCAAEPGAAQRALRAFDDEHYVARPAAAGARRHPAAAGPGPLSRLGDDGAELELHPADGHTADGMAFLMPLGRRARVRRLPVAGRDPDDLRRRLGDRLPRRRSSGCRRSSTRRPRSSRATARRCPGGEARRRSSTRTSRTSRALGPTARPRRLPERRRTAAQKQIHAANATRLDPSCDGTSGTRKRRQRYSPPPARSAGAVDRHPQPEHRGQRPGSPTLDRRERSVDGVRSTSASSSPESLSETRLPSRAHRPRRSDRCGSASVGCVEVNQLPSSMSTGGTGRGTNEYTSAH